MSDLSISVKKLLLAQCLGDRSLERKARQEISQAPFSSLRTPFLLMKYHRELRHAIACGSKEALLTKYKSELLDEYRI